MTLATHPRTDPSHVPNAQIDYAETILDLVGNTPLVRLSRVTRDLGPIDRQPLNPPSDMGGYPQRFPIPQ